MFKKKFLPAIRSGEKTQTIRLWNVCRMKSGQRSYIPGAATFACCRSSRSSCASLTDADAVPDGFASADALRHELATLYADQLAAGHRAYRIRFELLSTKSKPPPWPRAAPPKPPASELRIEQAIESAGDRLRIVGDAHGQHQQDHQAAHGQPKPAFGGRPASVIAARSATSRRRQPLRLRAGGHQDQN